jgi:triosephosphate isomerase (TIM)
MSVLLAGNWKMYKTRKQAVDFIDAMRPRIQQAAPNLPQMVICAPFTLLESLQNAIAELPIQVGAQTMADKLEGAFTGEISVAMLTDLGLNWVIVGHSERRQYYGETNDTVAAKTKLALEHKLTPIVCVGETLDQRDQGITDTLVTEQVNAVLHTGVDPKQVVFAYEPIWAIGTGKVCEADEANRVCALIQALAPGSRVLYGGSVKPDNATVLFGQPAIDGALIGGASLEPDSYWALVDIAMRNQKNNSLGLEGPGFYDHTDRYPSVGARA